MPTSKWDIAITSALVLCALVTTGAVVHRSFFAAPAAPAAPPAKATYIQDWASHLEKGIRLGSPAAPVQLVEFADFECPACADFQRPLSTVRQRYPAEVTVTYVHFPLQMHRFAELAARVSECAADQGRFEAMQDFLFEKQREIGLKPWSEFATEAGVSDLPSFESCVSSKEPVARISSGKELGEKLGINGTPTLIVNGWQLPRPPSEKELDRMVKEILAGRSPVGSDGQMLK